MDSTGSGNNVSDREQSSSTSIASATSELDALANTWLTDHRNNFDPFLWSSNAQRRLRRKACSEAAMYLYIASQFQNSIANRALHDKIIEIANESGYQNLLRRHPKKILYLGYPMVYANQMGTLNERGKRTVESVLSEPAVWAKERVPHRRLDLWYFCETYGYTDHEIEPDVVIRSSCVHNELDIINSSLADAYSFTHNIFYYTGFGTGVARFSQPPIEYNCQTVLTGLLLRYLAENDCDAVLEILTAGIIQHQLPVDLVQYTLNWILKRSKRYGCVPGPEIDDLQIASTREAEFSIEEETITEWDDQTQAWAQHYHTNLMVCIAATIIESTRIESVDGRVKTGMDLETKGNQLHELGNLLVTLSDYDLGHAANQMERLAGKEVTNVFPDVFEYAISHLTKQQNGDDFGFWTDERTLYRSLGKSGFHEEMVDPTTTACEKALAAIEQDPQREREDDTQ